MTKFILATTLILVSSLVHANIKGATYEVPTSQNYLKEASLFKIENVSFTKQNSKVNLSYLVPEELTGIKNMVQFTGDLNSNGGKLNSEYGQLTCLSNNRQMMCTVSHQKLNFDSELAKSIMVSKFQGQELTNRLSIQQKFSTDPVGVIRIYFK